MAIQLDMEEYKEVFERTNCILQLSWDSRNIMWFELLNVDEKNKTNAIKQSINAVPSTESASLEDCSETDFVSDCATNSGNLKLKTKHISEALLSTTIPDDLPLLVGEDVLHESQDIVPKGDNASKEVRKKNSLRDVNIQKAKRTSYGYSDYCQLVKEGSEALIRLSFKVACIKYASAIAILKSGKKKSFSISCIDEILLKYCYAKSCFGKHTYKDIDGGLKEMDEIINDYCDVFFPLAYYGKVLGHLAQNNFKEARNMVLKLNDELKKGKSIKVYYYPCHEDKVIEESDQEKLKKLLNEITLICNNPPSPNAVCHHSSPTHRKNEIYYADPEFQGFIQFKCQDRCNVHYHLSCWRNIKNERKLYRDKEYLGTECFTPDCKSFISKIELIGIDGSIRKTLCHSNNESKEHLLKEESHPSQTLTRTDIKKPAKCIGKKKNLTLKSKVNSSISFWDKYEYPIAWEESIPDTRRGTTSILQKKRITEENKPLMKKCQKKTKIKLSYLATGIDNFSSQHPEHQKNCCGSPDSAVDGCKARNTMFFDIHELHDAQYLTNDNIDLWFPNKSEQNLVEFLEGYIKIHGPTLITSQTFLQMIYDLPIEIQQIIIECGGMKEFLISNRFDIIGNYLLLPMQIFHVTGNSSSLFTALDLANNGNYIRQFLDLADFKSLTKAVSYPSLNIKNVDNQINQDMTVHHDDSKDKAASFCQIDSKVCSSVETMTSSYPNNLSQNYSHSQFCDSSHHSVVDKMALIEKQHKALSDEYQDLKDKLIQSKKELSRSKDVYNRKKEEWQDVIKILEKGYESLQMNYENIIKKYETEKRKLAEQVRLLSEKNEMLIRENESLNEREEEIMTTVSLKDSLLEEKSKQLDDAENTIQILIQKLESVEKNHERCTTTGNLRLDHHPSAIGDQKQPSVRKVAGNSHLSPPLLDANHKRLNRLFVYQRNNAEHLDCSSSCHSSFQNIDYNGSQLSKPGVKKKTKMKPKPSSSGTAISLSRKTGTTPKPISESMPNLVPSNSGLKWSDVVATKSHPSSPHDGKETSHSKSNRNSQVDIINSGRAYREVILETLYQEFPDLKSCLLRECLQEAVVERDFSSTGLKFNNIMERMRNLTPNGLTAHNCAEAYSKSSISGSQELCTSKFKTPQQKRYRNEECNICLDEMDDKNVDYLNCGHAYHSKCIRKWFNTRSTCPNCGLYALLDEEYPPLE